MTKTFRGRIVLPTYTKGEELLNAVSHGIGTALGVAALVLCVVRAAIYGGAWAVVSGSIYGASLIVMYCMSTLYHAITNKKARKVFRVLDHTSIYFLIAGTYTPITLVTLRGALGFVIFGIVWAGAILGITLNAVSIERFKKFSMISYIIMGWAVVLGAAKLYQAMPPQGIAFLVAGGVFYTAGIVFYKLKRVKYMHGVWHLFVLAGSVMHFFCIYLYIMPIGR